LFGGLFGYYELPCSFRCHSINATIIGKTADFLFIVAQQQDCQLASLLITVTAVTDSFAGGRLILASRSPRRSDLLAQAGLMFDVVPSTVNENILANKAPEDHVRILAEAKAAEVSADYPGDWILGADTVVSIQGEILGKPENKTEARQMLERLSGTAHTVFTGYCLCCTKAQRSFSETVETRVEFRPITKQEIAWYITTQEPYDKAGGYAAQGLASVFIKRIEGSYTNVVGLPLCEVMACLLKAGVVRL
jgi:septum formation protein